MGLGDDFIAFLDRYEVLPWVVAFFIVIAVLDLVKSLTENVLMPLISFVLGKGDLQGASLSLGTASVKWGAFLNCLLYFLIVVLLTLLVVKYVQKRKAVTAPKK